MLTINSKILACILSLSLFSGCTHFTKHDANPIPPENRLIVFTSHKPEVYAPIIKEFELRTGISVEVQAGGTTEMLEKIKKWRRCRCHVWWRCSKLYILSGLY